MKKHRVISIFALAIGFTLAVGWLCIGLFDWTIPQGGVRPALIRYMPSLIMVGAGIGYGTVRLGAPTKAAVFGALCGWIVGTGVGLLVFELDLNDRRLTLSIFYVVQILSGITVGLFPAYWMRSHEKVRG